MELKPITKRRADGRLDTDICLIDTPAAGATDEDSPSVILNFGSMHNGVYFCRLRVGAQTITRSVIAIK